MMSINDLNYEVVTAADERANTLRHWIGLITALVDAGTVLAVVGSASLSYHFAAYGHLGNDKITAELASMIAAIFVFTNLCADATGSRTISRPRARSPRPSRSGT